MLSILSKTLVLLFLFSHNLNAQEGWVDMLGKGDFSDFVILNGTAEYELKDNTLIGISKMNTPNTFLATKKTYGDFILEFEVKIENGMNSGVQFRSHSLPEYRDGKVHGYQSEIETSPRKWAGGIYDEGRRNWLYPLSGNPAGQEAFITGGWNHFRIEAIGHNIRTWVNGIHCANLADNLTSEGFIAFQVHSIGSTRDANKKVMWRNIKIKTTDLEQSRKKPSPQVRVISYLKNMLTEQEKRAGFRLLWDGKTAKGWKGAKLDHFPGKGWEMNDGVLTVLPSDGGESTNGGDIITEEQFSNFEFEVDFKITEGANSGIKYFVDKNLNKGEGSAIGLEFQILDDEKHPDAKKGNKGNRTIGSLYDLIRADNLSEANRDTKRFFGVNNWNKARIVSKNGKVEHWLNNVKVVEFDRFSQIFNALVEKSKYVDWPNFGRFVEGNILLQDHGDRVSFHSIKVREL